MKKLLALTLSVLMACTMLTACGEKDDEKDGKDEKTTTTTAADDKKDDEPADDKPADDKPADDKPAEKVDIEVSLSTDPDAPLGETVGEEVELSEDIFANLKALEGAKEYTMDVNATMSSEGMTMEMPMYVTTDGTNTYVNTSVFGMSVESLSLDGVNYVIVDDEKAYCKMEDGSSTVDASAEDVTQMLDGALAAEKVTLEGEEFIRVKYENEDAEGSYGFGYFKDGNVYFMAMVSEESGNMLMVVNELSTKANADLLKLPADYKEITEEEYSEIILGDMDFGDLEGLE